VPEIVKKFEGMMISRDDLSRSTLQDLYELFNMTRSKQEYLEKKMREKSESPETNNGRAKHRREVYQRYISDDCEFRGSIYTFLRTYLSRQLSRAIQEGGVTLN